MPLNEEISVLSFMHSWGFLYVCLCVCMYLRLSGVLMDIHFVVQL